MSHLVLIDGLKESKAESINVKLVLGKVVVVVVLLVEVVVGVSVLLQAINTAEKNNILKMPSPSLDFIKYDISWFLFIKNVSNIKTSKIAIGNNLYKLSLFFASTFTLGFFGIGWFLDFLWILLGSYKDANGQPIV